MESPPTSATPIRWSEAFVGGKQQNCIKIQMPAMSGQKVRSTWLNVMANGGKVKLNKYTSGCEGEKYQDICFSLAINHETAWDNAVRS